MNGRNQDNKEEIHQRSVQRLHEDNILEKRKGEVKKSQKSTKATPMPFQDHGMVTVHEKKTIKKA